MLFDFSQLKSSQSEIAWPALYGGQSASMMALLFQLQQSEWMPQAQLEALQLHQLTLLLRHAVNTVPYYREHFKGLKIPSGADFTAESWRNLPILERSEVQEAGRTLRSTKIPPGHGKIGVVESSGSTGLPVRVEKTAAVQFIYRAITIRDHLWHRRDFSARMVNIRPNTSLKPGKPEQHPGWGAADLVFRTSKSKTLSSRTPITEQATWLIKQNPAYLNSIASNVKALATYFIENDLSLPGLRGVRNFGEVLDEETIALIRKAWDVKVTDAYSTEEIGYIALQCPEEGRYHVQSEASYLEVIDEQGNPCKPGEIGKVVVTPLHNYAMPLIRYAVGDYAEVASPCACGRGLPTLKRILGRTRNMLTLPDGSRHWPSYPAELWTRIAPIRQFQLIQRDLETIEVRISVARPLRAEEEKALIKMLQERFGYPFTIQFTYVDTFERASNGKFEDFISEVSL